MADFFSLQHETTAPTDSKVVMSAASVAKEERSLYTTKFLVFPCSAQPVYKHVSDNWGV